MITNLFITYCHDRHIDPDVQAFTDKQAAIDYAWEYMRDSVAHPELLTEEKSEGCVLWIQYEPEDDHAFVVERTPDNVNQTP